MVILDLQGALKEKERARSSLVQGSIYLQALCIESCAAIGI